MAAHGVSEAQIGAQRCDDAWRALMAFQVRRSRELMLSGAPLGADLPGRSGLEIRATVQGGLRILEKIETAGYDVFRRRPVLEWRDWPLVLWRALTRSGSDPRQNRGQTQRQNRGQTPTEENRGLTPAWSDPHDARRVLPAEGRGERVELLLLVPVPAAGAPARDHGAVRVLPRGGRRGRRGRRPATRGHQARLVAPGGGAPLRRGSAAPRDPRLAANARALRRHRAAAERDHRRHGDGPHADALSRLRRPGALLLSRRGRGGPAGGRASSATPMRARWNMRSISAPRSS